jgi:hypothetical protein
MPALAEGAGAGTPLHEWQQGDVILGDAPFFMHLADLREPLTDESKEQSTNEPGTETDPLTGVVYQPRGVVIVTQTCDVVREAKDRPFIELCPLVEVDDRKLEEIRRLKRPQFAFIPGVAHLKLVADLDRSMTAEKSVLVGRRRVEGCKSDPEVRNFAEALARKRSRFAFPDDFSAAMGKMYERLRKLHGRKDGAGAAAQSLSDIRVRAAPSWNADRVFLTFFFILDDEAPPPTQDTNRQAEEWVSLFDTSGRFQFDQDMRLRICYLADLDAATYVDSDHLEYDSLSTSSMPT